MCAYVNIEKKKTETRSTCRQNFVVVSKSVWNNNKINKKRNKPQLKSKSHSDRIVSQMI